MFDNKRPLSSFDIESVKHSVGHILEFTNMRGMFRVIFCLDRLSRRAISSPAVLERNPSANIEALAHRRLFVLVRVDGTLPLVEEDKLARDFLDGTDSSE